MRSSRRSCAPGSGAPRRCARWKSSAPRMCAATSTPRAMPIRCGSTTIMRAAPVTDPASCRRLSSAGCRSASKKAPSDPAELRRQLPLPSGYTNVRNAGSETEWLQPVYLGEALFTRSTIVDIVARPGKAGLGIYISQEEQVLNERQELVLCRRHTLAVFPDKRSSDGAKDPG